MRTSKRNIIHLDPGDEIEIEAGGRRFIVTSDPDRHSGYPIIDLPEGAEMIFDSRDVGTDNNRPELDPPTMMENPLEANSSIFI